jgi:hypothetical protein
MHFWIDKRSTYGLGQLQRPGGISGFGYQPRRNRNKTSHPQNNTPQTTSSTSMATSSTTRQQNIAPSTSSSNNHQGKSTNHHHHHHHHHHHRTRNNQHRAGDGVGLQDILIEESTPHNPNSMDLNSHHVPVSVYPNDDITTHPTIDSTSSRTNGVNQWLPIQIICGLCMILAITLVLLKLYFESYMTGFQVLSLILMSFVFLILTSLLSLLRSRRKRPSSQDTSSQMQSTINSHHNNQAVIVQATPPSEPPPPYALALTLPEKQSDIKISTPPPSYEKINII